MDMTEESTGKIDPTLFETEIAPRLGADREDVAVGPAPGVDFGVLAVEDSAVILATDPISVLPALGFERAGRFATRIVLADVAVSGLGPTHLTVSFALPPEMTDEQFARVWTGVHETCREHGVAVATGHTARYEGCRFPWVGAATALAVGDPDRIRRPDGARPGDDLLVTTGPAVEAVGLLTTLFPDRIDLPAEQLATAQDRLAETGVVRDAHAAAEAGARAIHDATEGGLLGACHEMAAGAGVEFTIDTDRVPTRPGVAAACEALGMDPWTATSAGTLVIASPPDATAAVLEALDARDTPVGIVGAVTEGRGVRLDGEPTTPPEQDASWPVYERLAGQQ